LKEEKNNHCIFVGIGSNIDRVKNIKSCIKLIQSKFEDIKISPVYETRSMGFDGPNFYNLVCSFYTFLDLYNLKKNLNNLELDHGRSLNETKFSSRTLDIDILYYDNLIISNDIIKLPRKEILDYDFVIQPLTDLAPNFIHPEVKIKHKNILEKEDFEKNIIKKIDFIF
tara:strand:+ start:725 stop:1231 length:507 start_codon:yes stop_codon:yes gene_type:complete